MTTKTVRNIVKIDEEKCNGCGICVPACAEGAIEVIDGKAKLVSEIYCDGLGACLGECPQDAITIEKRKSEAFDEEAVEHHLKKKQATLKMADPEPLPCGCPSTTVEQFDRGECAEQNIPRIQGTTPNSMLGHWPVQLTLVPPTAPFLQDADLILAGDCAPFAYAGFHQDFIKDHALLVACPKLDDFQAHQAKLSAILSQSSVKSVTVVRMEVPCCSGLVHMAKQAINDSGKDIPLKEVVVGVKGELK